MQENVLIGSSDQKKLDLMSFSPAALFKAHGMLEDMANQEGVDLDEEGDIFAFVAEQIEHAIYAMEVGTKSQGVCRTNSFSAFSVVK